MDVPEFDDAGLAEWLDGADEAALDALPFGLIAMNREGNVTHYNATEARAAGLTPSRVVGRHFFSSVAPCTNNYLVAQRFELEDELDATLPYVFTLRMAPTPVELRLLKRRASARMYMAVRRRPPAA